MQESGNPFVKEEISKYPIAVNLTPLYCHYDWCRVEQMEKETSTKQMIALVEGARKVLCRFE